MSDERRVGDRFDARAADYGGWLTRFMGERELRAIRPFITAGCTVLDFGCGGGRTTADLLRRGCRVTAYDISPEMLAAARHRAGEQAEWTADAAALRGRTWPCITLVGVLDYYCEVTALLGQVRELLAPGGRLIATVPNATSPLAWAYVAASRFTVPAHLHRPEAVVRAAAALGLTCVGRTFACPAAAWLGHTAVLCFQCGE